MRKRKSTEEIMSSDKPIENAISDKFQRSTYAKRIAETIANRKATDCIVIGLYGVWGEGKSSLVNLIKHGIESTNKDIVQLIFNPWRYTDEKTLLQSFFNDISISLTAKGSGTKTEEIGRLLVEYGGLASPFKLGTVAEKVGKALVNNNLESIKTRIENLLESENKKIVIYLDDIDRLDKDELYSILKLVKLTGDFKNITYVLSFDNQMVAAAISSRFGKQDSDAGHSFLEKIIQVPLQIPKAQTSDLKDYCLKIVDSALQISNVQLTEDQASRFVHLFTMCPLSVIGTPRKAVQYGNSLNFSLPLLKGEVNMVDLLLIEAVKIFFPKFYSLIQTKSEYFLSAYNHDYGAVSSEEKKKRINKIIPELSSEFDPDLHESIIEFFGELFPNFKTAYQNIDYPDRLYEKWYLEKRICSGKYFRTYFSYCVLKGNISDVELQRITSNQSEKTLPDLVRNISSLLTESNSDVLVTKLGMKIISSKWSESKLLMEALTRIDLSYTKNDATSLFRFETAWGMAAMTIHRGLNKFKNDQDTLTFAKRLMTVTPALNFAYEVYYSICSTNSDETKLYTLDERYELIEILRLRAVKECKNGWFFKKYPEYSHAFLDSWKRTGKEDMKNYIQSFLDNEPINVVILLECFSPLIRSSAEPEPFYGNFHKDYYLSIKKIYPPRSIKSKIIKYIGKEKLNSEEVVWAERGINGYSRENLLRQFVYWYDSKTTGKSTQMSNRPS